MTTSVSYRLEKCLNLLLVKLVRAQYTDRRQMTKKQQSVLLTK